MQAIEPPRQWSRSTRSGSTEFVWSAIARVLRPCPPAVLSILHSATISPLTVKLLLNEELKEPPEGRVEGLAQLPTKQIPLSPTSWTSTTAAEARSPASTTIEARAVSAEKILTFTILCKVYPVHVTTRKSLGLMMRKLSVTESQRSAQFRGTFSRRKPSVASANWAQVA